MNRLWVRLSMMIGGVLFFVFFLQFLSIMTSPDFGPPGAADPVGLHAPDDGGPLQAPREEIAGRLVDFMLLSVVVGLGAEVIIGRVVSAPISEMARAAHRIGQGGSSARATSTGSSPGRADWRTAHGPASTAASPTRARRSAGRHCARRCGRLHAAEPGG
jgi:hypothetical protein